jgi:hypothetical protein
MSLPEYTAFGIPACSECGKYIPEGEAILATKEGKKFFLDKDCLPPNMELKHIYLRHGRRVF